MIHQMKKIDVWWYLTGTRKIRRPLREQQAADNAYTCRNEIWWLFFLSAMMIYKA
jgi:hypothetical protein